MAKRCSSLVIGYGNTAQRKVLVVFSDSCPMDTATSTANDQFYLDNHLKQVIERESTKNSIEIHELWEWVSI